MPLKKFKNNIPLRVYIKYSLLQIPGTALLALVLFFLGDILDLSHYLKYIILLLWILKDIIMFPFVWQSYDSTGRNTGFSMIGKRGVARERLAPSGYIRVGGELWKAETTDGHIESGEPVTVIHVDGLKLTVEPIEE